MTGKIWQSFLKKTFLYCGLRLRRPLGKWLKWDDDWEWYFSPSQECLFRYRSDGWKYFSQVHKRDKLPTFLNTGKETNKPEDLQRATIYVNKNRLVCTGWAPIKYTQNPKADTFLQHLSRLDPEEHWCFDYLDMTDDRYIMAEAIKQGNAIAVSDGSFQDQYGPAAWVLEGDSSSGRISGAVTAPGNAKDQSAYRSELTGIYSIMMCTKNLCEYFNITSGSITLGCDGQSALDKAFNQVSILQIGESNYDLLFAIRTLWANSPLTWTFRHILGHQDDHSSLENLDRWAKLNIEMDSRAKKHMPIAKHSSRHCMIFAEPWSLWIQGGKIATELSDTIYDLVHSTEAKNYWTNKDNVGEDVMDRIDWESIATAMEESRRNKRIFISKHAAECAG
jgi:hypothetical protein